MPTTDASCRPSTYSISSGQSLRNGNSVEPGLPNTLRMPNSRNSASVACLTVIVRPADLAGLRVNVVCPQFVVIPGREAKRSEPGIHTPDGGYGFRACAKR